MNEIATKFVKWDIPELDKLADTFPYRMMVKLNAGHKLSRDEKNRLSKDVISYHGSIHLQGWSFDLRRHLTGYLVKQYGSWKEYYSLDKTALRSHIYGRIDKIVTIN